MMDSLVLKQIITNNIVAKDKLLKQIHSTLFVFKRDFNQLKEKENFEESLGEVIDILNVEVDSIKKLENLLEEVETKGTIKSIPTADINARTLSELAGDILTISESGDIEYPLIQRMDEILVNL